MAIEVATPEQTQPLVVVAGVPIVSNWRTVLKKSMVVWLALAGTILLNVVDFALANPETLRAFLTAWPDRLRDIVLLLIPFVRIVRQQSLQVSAPPP